MLQSLPITEMEQSNKDKWQFLPHIVNRNDN